jgi:N-acetylmuramoyl-L-alanine amidase
VVDQFVYHFDVCGTSRQCFKVLHDVRCLSVHFMLDIDGTIYQTLDLKERAWHATISNTRSIGIEIANMGAYGVGKKDPFDEWYALDDRGRAFITIPKRLGDGGVRTKNFVGRPMRPKPVVGEIQGTMLRQYDYTPEQYESLIKLTAALSRVFPKLKCDFPKDAQGQLVPRKLPDPQLNSYQGLIGHYHIQTNKTDPGPAFHWEYILENARRYL